MPSILINGQEDTSSLLQQSSRPPIRKRVELFDFRERATQEKARAKHIRRLRRRGYDVTAHTESTKNCRFITNPYEGAVDDYAVIKSKSRGTLESGKQHSQASSNSVTKVTFSPPADEETLAKIEIAFSEWKLRKEILAEKSIGSRRKRSSSHSPPRSAPVVCSEKFSSSCSSSVEFLNHSGNIRRHRKPGNDDLNYRES